MDYRKCVVSISGYELDMFYFHCRGYCSMECRDGVAIDSIGIVENIKTGEVKEFGPESIRFIK